MNLKQIRILSALLVFTVCLSLFAPVVLADEAPVLQETNASPFSAFTFLDGHRLTPLAAPVLEKDGQLVDGTYIVRILPGSVHRTADGYTVDLEVSGCDRYPAGQIDRLQLGDRIVTTQENGQQTELTITALQRDEWDDLLINGGYGAGGLTLQREDGSYRPRAYGSDLCYYQAGTFTLPAAAALQIQDHISLTLSNGSRIWSSVTYPLSEFLGYLARSGGWQWNENSIALVKDGTITALHHF